MSIVPTLSQTDCDLHIGQVVPLTGGQLHPASWDQAGDMVKVSGVVWARGITDAKTLRAQLAGYVDNDDEEVVPVRWDADATVDGYYRIRSAEVTMRGSSLYHGVFDVSIELERALAWSAPLFESPLLGATLTNGLGVTGSSWHAIPNVVDNYSQTSVTANTTRVGEDGTTRVVFFGTTFTITPRYLLVPASYYVGASRLKVQDSSNVLQIVTGRQAESKPYQWQITNGFCRVTPRNPGSLDVEIFDGTQWERVIWSFDYATADVNEFSSLAVLRNSPEEVIVRMALGTTAGTSEGRVLMDVALRRGEAMARVFIQSETARAWRTYRAANEAATNITGGIRATNNDAAGNRYILLSATATTKDNTVGALTLPVAATSVGFGVGSSLAGSAAAAPNVITGTRGLVEQYFSAQSERMSVAGV